MEIQIEKVGKLAAKADKIFLSPEGEDVLVQLLDIRDKVEEAIKEAKERLEKAGIEVNPNFTSIQGDKIKVFYRAYGARFYLDESLLADISKDFYTAEQKTVYKVIPEAVIKFTEENKGMPIGIKEVERVKSLTFTRKEKKENET